jgi:hypothetical protein
MEEGVDFHRQCVNSSNEWLVFRALCAIETTTRETDYTNGVHAHECYCRVFYTIRVCLDKRPLCKHTRVPDGPGINPFFRVRSIHFRTASAARRRRHPVRSRQYSTGDREWNYYTMLFSPLAGKFIVWIARARESVVPTLRGHRRRPIQCEHVEEKLNGIPRG